MFSRTVLGKTLRAVRQMLTGEELDEIGATLETSPRKYTTTCAANGRYLCICRKI